MGIPGRRWHQRTRGDMSPTMRVRPARCGRRRCRAREVYNPLLVLVAPIAAAARGAATLRAGERP